MSIEAGTIAAKLVGVSHAKRSIAEAVLAKGGGLSVGNEDGQLYYIDSIPTSTTPSAGGNIFLTGVHMGPNTSYEAKAMALNQVQTDWYQVDGAVAADTECRWGTDENINGTRTYIGFLTNMGGWNQTQAWGSSVQTPSGYRLSRMSVYSYDASTTTLSSTNEMRGTAATATVSDTTRIGTYTKGFTLFGRSAQASTDANIANATVSCRPARFYYIKFWESGVLTHHFVPWRKDGVVCIKDLVTGDFLYNLGTGRLFGCPLAAPSSKVMPERFADYGETIRKIPQSLDTLPLEDEEKTWCIFVNVDGDAVACYTKTETAALTALPRVPEPPFVGLMNPKWNWTLAQVKASTMPMCIGPIYDTDDGRTWIDIEIPSAGYEWHYYSQDNKPNGRIDWGDGSALDTMSSGMHAHAYASAGSYRIKLFQTDGGTYRGASGSLCGAYRSTSNAAYAKAQEDILCLRRFFDMSTTANVQRFGGAQNLEHLINGSNITTSYFGIGEDCHKLKQVTMPPTAVQGVHIGGNYGNFVGNTSLKCVCYPPNMTRTGSATNTGEVGHYSGQYVARHSVGLTTDATGVGNYWASYMPNVRVLHWPGNLSNGTATYMFAEDWSLRRIVLPEGFTVKPTTISTNFFIRCYALESLGGLDLSEVATLGTSAFSNCRRLWYGETVLFPALTSIAQNSLNGTAARKFVIGAVGTTLSTSSTGQFGYNFMLESLVFLGNVDYVRASFVNQCYALKTVAFPNATAVPTLDNTNAFSNCPSLQQIVVPDSLYATWKATANWSSTTNNIVNKITKASEAAPY